MLKAILGLGASSWLCRMRAGTLSLARLIWLAMALCLPSLAIAQHTSTECPAQTGTVTSGGTVTINISDCEYDYLFGGEGSIDGGSYGAADFESHGTATTRHSGGQWFLDYSHNGSTGIGSTDVFENSDGSFAGSGDIQFTITINPSASPITVSPASLPTLTAGTSLSQTLTSSGGTAPYTYTLQSGTLPVGLSLSSAGVLSGTPTQRGAYSFSVRSTDNGGDFVDKGYTGTVDSPTLSITPTSATAIQSVAFSETLTAIGGVAPHAYQLETGSFPAGISISSAGVISGTTSDSTGTYPVTIRVTDSSTGPGTYFEVEDFTLNVSAVPPVANAVSLTVAYNAAATPVTLNITGGAATSVAVDTAASHGTAIASGTSITYQPTTGYAGPDSFTYTATNGNGTSAPATVTVTVNDPVITITPSGGFAATVGAPYSQTFTWNGGAQPWSGFQVANLPAGLTITGSTANSVTVSGTSTQAGSFTLNVSATDSSTGNGPYTVGQAFVLSVAAPVLALSPAATTFNTSYAAAFSQSFTASGGTGPYSYAVTGSLPAGVALSGNTVSGTPTVPGSFNFTITATDTGSTGTGAPFSVAQNYTLSVAAASIALSPATLPGATAGTAYSQTLTASGGVAAYSFALSAGSLPAGLTLSTGGALSGTPTEAGNFSITVTATDANGQTGSRAYTLVVGAPTLTMTPAPGTLNAPYGVPFSQTFVASGSPGPYNRVMIGSLPTGLTISGNTISGTPTQLGSFNISIMMVDTGLTGTGAPFSITQNYTIEVTATTGQCGTANNVATLIAPTANLCDAGTATGMSTSTGGHTWTCSGSGGADAQCSAPGLPSTGSGGGSVSASFVGTGCTVDSATLVAAPTGGPTGVNMPYGVLNFALSGCSGGNVTVTATFSGSVAGMRWWKYIGGAWRQMPASLAGNSATFVIVDNGPFDADPAPGSIVDPGGPGIGGAAALATVPTLSQWALLLLSGLLAAASFGTLRRRIRSKH